MVPRENVQTVTDKQKKLPPRRAYRHCSQINVLTKYTHTHKPRSISLSKNECLTYTPPHTHKPLKRSAPYYSTSSDMFSVFLYIVRQRHFCLPLCSIWHMRDMPKYLWVFTGSSILSDAFTESHKRSDPLWSLSKTTFSLNWCLFSLYEANSVYSCFFSGRVFFIAE